jgi:hypothetical protein
LSAFSTVAHEFNKDKVVFNGQSGQDLPEEINEVCPPSSSSCSPHRQTGARTVQQEGNEKEGEESLLLSPKVESIESDDEEGEHLTTQETNSPQPPVNEPFFVIAESDFESEEEEQDSLLSVKVESVESESEEDGDPAADRQLTIDETGSLPENFHFIIDDSEDEKVEPVDDGLLPVNCTA